MVKQSKVTSQQIPRPSFKPAILIRKRMGETHKRSIIVNNIIKKKHTALVASTTPPFVLYEVFFLLNVIVD